MTIPHALITSLSHQLHHSGGSGRPLLVRCVNPVTRALFIILKRSFQDVEYKTCTYLDKQQYTYSSFCINSMALASQLIDEIE